MIFFGKVTKRIAFAGNFRYTVTRIAPAICGLCALLPKQLTPRQGTKTVQNVRAKFAQVETTHTPPGDENNPQRQELLAAERNNSHPARGRKPRRLIDNTMSYYETTYTPSGDENHQAAMRGFVRPAKQLTPRQGTKIFSVLVLLLLLLRNNLHPVRGRKYTYSSQFLSFRTETTHTPSGDENSFWM